MLKGVGIPLEKCFKSHNFFFSNIVKFNFKCIYEYV